MEFGMNLGYSLLGKTQKKNKSCISHPKGLAKNSFKIPGMNLVFQARGELALHQ